jgi:hypothetical protein
MLKARRLVLKARELEAFGLPQVELRRLNEACGVKVLKDAPDAVLPLAEAFLDRAARDYGLPQPDAVSL